MMAVWAGNHCKAMQRAQLEQQQQQQQLKMKMSPCLADKD